jgi:hypothetical protein
MVSECPFDRSNCLFGASQAEQIHAIIDARVFVRRRSAVEHDGLPQRLACFFRFAQALQRQSQQPVNLSVLPVVRKSAAQDFDCRLEAVQKVQRPAIIHAGVRKRGIEVAGGTQRLLGGVEIPLSGIDDTQGFPSGRILRPEFDDTLESVDGCFGLVFREEPHSEAVQLNGLVLGGGARAKRHEGNC